MHARVHNTHAYIHAYTHTYIKYIHAYYIPMIHTCIHTCIHTFIFINEHVYSLSVFTCATESTRTAALTQGS